MKRSLFAVIAFVCSLFLSCAKENFQEQAAPKGVKVTVRASLPVLPDDPATKLTFDPEESMAMTWDGGETLYIMPRN